MLTIHVNVPCHVAGQQKRARATRDSGNGGEKAKHVLKRDLKNGTIRDEDDFEEGLGLLGMKSMRIPGGRPIDLCRLAKKTVNINRKHHEDVIQEYRQQLDDHQKMEKAHEDQLKLNIQAGKLADEQLETGINEWRYAHPKPGMPARIVPEGQDWQIMFNLIAYIFYPAQEQIPKIARILTTPSDKKIAAAACSDLERKPERPSEDITHLVEELARQEAASGGEAAADNVIASKEDNIQSQIMEREKQMGNVARGFKVWINKDLGGPLAKLYENYDRVQTVREFDKMLALSRDEKQRHIFKLLLAKRAIVPETSCGVGTSTLILTYISRELSAAGKALPTGFISDRITKMRPVVELNKRLGDGILALLGSNNRDLLSGLSEDEDRSGANEKSAKKTRNTEKTKDTEKTKNTEIPEQTEKTKNKLSEKIAHMADCMRRMDQLVFHGRLANMLADVDELILKPALELRKRQVPSSPLLKSPSKEILDKLDIGEKLDYVLAHMKGGMGAGRDIDSEETREKTRKRGRSSGNEDEGANQAKRRRHVDDSAGEEDADIVESVGEEVADRAGAGADANGAERGVRRLRSTRLQASKGKTDKGLGHANRRRDEFDFLGSDDTEG